MKCMVISSCLNSPRSTWLSKPYKGSGAVLGFVSNSMMSTRTWIRIVGIPLHLWSQKIFHEIGNLCRGMHGHRRTELKNRMKWARILVSNDGRNIPKEVVICRNGVKHYFLIWSEIKIRFEILPEMDSRVVGKERIDKDPVNPIIQRLIDCSYCYEVQQSHFSGELPATEYGERLNSKAVTVFKKGVSEKHVTSLNEIEKLDQLLKPNKEPTVSRRGGPDFSSQVIFNDLNNNNAFEQNSDISMETPEIKYIPRTEPAAMQIRK